MIYLQLLLSYLKIGFFGFGGGYAMLSLIQNEIVVQRGWLTSEQLTDIIAISQVTPGPIAINSATYVGYAVTGTVWGAALATLAACIPSLTLMLAATKFYLRLRANRYVSGAMEGMKRRSCSSPPKPSSTGKAGRYSPPPSSLRSKR